MASCKSKEGDEAPVDLLTAVRDSTAWVCAGSQHVKLNAQALSTLAAEVAANAPGHQLKLISADGGRAADGDVGWGEDIHFVGDEESTIQYILVVDALNFCFWPSQGQWEYEDLSMALKRALEEDSMALGAERLAAMTEDGLCRLLGGKSLPNMPARVEHLQQVGKGLLAHWGGSAAEMVRSCSESAQKLVETIVASFPGFRDHLTYQGKQVFFYKRAQILAGDIWGALKGRGLGSFSDVHKLTMFADYRVPQILEACGVLEYSEELKGLIASKRELPQGSQFEVEIRAWTVQAVEELKAELSKAHGLDVLSIKIDWYLWEEGERKDRAGVLPPHHRTLTTFY